MLHDPPDDTDAPSEPGANLPFIAPGTTRPILIGSDIYRHSSYGSRHPLAIPRVSTTLDLIRAMGWLDEAQYMDSPAATPLQLARFHDPAYIQALIDGERDQALDPERRQRYNLGRLESPIFPELFRRPATAAGASILAADLLRHGGIVHSPAGGTHHGRPARASGFCFVNDPVLAILSLLDQGLTRIVYLDLDAHHGDGVEDAFTDDERVFTLSIHEAGRWPFTGSVHDRAGGWARNLPVPAGFNDAELVYLLDTVVIPLCTAFAPQAMILQCGADALADDPLSKLTLSNRGLWHAVATTMDLAPRVLVLGGGGYNPWSVARCWAGIWAVLNRFEPDMELTPEAQAVLKQLVWHRAQGRTPPDRWFTTLADPHGKSSVRDEIRRVAELAIA